MILLRAWSHEYQEMYYAKRDDSDYCYMKREYAPFVFEVGFSGYDSDQIEIMLGCEFSNQKIYEKDIVKCFRRDDIDCERPQILEVTFLNGCFMIGTATTHEFFRLYQQNFKIIKNKFQTLENDQN